MCRRHRNKNCSVLSLLIFALLICGCSHAGDRRALENWKKTNASRAENIATRFLAQNEFSRIDYPPDRFVSVNNSDSGKDAYRQLSNELKVIGASSAVKVEVPTGVLFTVRQEGLFGQGVINSLFYSVEGRSMIVHGESWCTFKIGEKWFGVLVDTQKRPDCSQK